jgi:TolB-like protein
MKKIISIAFFSFMAVFLGSGLSQAAQVVSDADKDWARQAIAQEQTLGANPSGDTVAVMYFHNVSGNGGLDPLSKGLAYMLMTDLAKAGNLQVVERVKLQALVEELGFGASGVVDAGTSPRVGKLLQAKHLVGGDILKAQASDLKISSSVVTVPKGDVLGNPQADGMLEKLFDMEKKILFQIISLLDVKVTPAEREELKKPMSTNTQALLCLFAAMDSSDRKDYQAAEGYYKKALENDPKLLPAQKGLDELKSLGLVSGAKGSRGMAQDMLNNTSHTSTLVPNGTDLRHGDPGSIEKQESTAGQVNIRW